MLLYLCLSSWPAGAEYIRIWVPLLEGVSIQSVCFCLAGNKDKAGAYSIPAYPERTGVGGGRRPANITWKAG